MSKVEPTFNQEVKARWIRALRSGKYKRGRHHLRTLRYGKPVFCCLGVLCEVMEATYDTGANFPPYSMLSELGLGRWSGARVLAALNDGDGLTLKEKHIKRPKAFRDMRGMSFNAIADWIEENL